MISYWRLGGRRILCLGKRAASLGYALGGGLAAGVVGFVIVPLQKLVPRNVPVGQLDLRNYVIDHFFLEKRGLDLCQGAGIFAIIVPHDLFFVGERARPLSQSLTDLLVRDLDVRPRPDFSQKE